MPSHFDGSAVETERSSVNREFVPADFEQLEPLAMPKPDLGQRHYPPGGAMDTLICFRGEERRGLHASYRKSFEDHEILAVEICPDDFTEFIPGSNRIGIGRTTDGRTVLQQQGWRGCTAACAEMLRADLGYTINIGNLANCNLGEHRDYLSAAGHKLIHTEISAAETPGYNPAKILEHCLKNGSGILDVGGHVVVLDRLEIPEKRATMRDPYHGWSVVVELDALLARCRRRIDFVQIADQE